MFLRIIHIILFLCLLIPVQVASQAWMKEIEDSRKSDGKEHDFPTIQRAFEKYWDNKPVEKGKGWKQFRRWENFMEPRVYPHGYLPIVDISSESEKQSLKSSGYDFSDWESFGPFDVPRKAGSNKKSGVGRINCIAFHPSNNDIMWAGAPSGGLWKTTNGGASWITTTDNLHSLGVSDIAVHPLNPDILYIATGDGDAGDTYSAGILKSDDGGLTWSSTSLSLSQNERIFFRRLLIDPQNPEILIAASNIGIYRTENGFNSHELVLSGHFKDLEFKPGKPSIIYAAEYNNNGNASVYRSDNSGNTFFKITKGMDIAGNVNRIELAVTPADPNLVMAVCSDASNDGLYAVFSSIDGGLNWNKIYDNKQKNLLGWSFDGSDEGGQGWYDLALAISPTNKNLVYVGGVNIWRSIDGGNSFSIIAHWIGSGSVDYVHADHHMLTHNPWTYHLYSCNDGGIYTSRNSGEDWTDISDGLSILQIYKIAGTELLKDLVLTGNQDNGSMKLEDSIWTEIYGGDGMECGIDPLDPDIQYVSLYYGRFFRSYNRGGNFKEISPEKAGKGAWVTPFMISPMNPATLYAAYENIYKSDNRGDTWDSISNLPTNGEKLRSLAVSEKDSHYIYTATLRKVWMTGNGGADWSEITQGLPALAITSLNISPYNPRELWVTLSGYNAGEKIYHSTDAGTNWINFSEGLPNVPVNSLAHQKNSDAAMYAGTDLGVYFRKHGMQEWVPLNNGLPNVIVNDLEIQYSHNRILAGTYGRGLWYSTIYNPSDTNLFAWIISSGNEVCVGDTLIFESVTSEVFDSLVWDVNGRKILQFENTPIHLTFAEPGFINVSITIYSKGESFTSSITEYFKVLELPDLTITANFTDYLYAGEEAILSAAGADRYDWRPAEFIDNPDSAIIKVRPFESTDYMVTGSIGKCSNTDTFRINLREEPVRVETIMENEVKDIVIYPNPGDGNFYINAGYNYTYVRIIVTDLSGKMILSEEYFNVPEHKEIPFSLNQKGVYLLIWQTPDLVLTKKVLVH